MTWSEENTMSAKFQVDTRTKRQNSNFDNKRRKTPSPSTMNQSAHLLRYSPKLGSPKAGKNKGDENNNEATLIRSSPVEIQQANIAYAGAKFSEPPAPSLLPKPPSSWIQNDVLPITKRCDISSKLKMLLNVEVVA